MDFSLVAQERRKYSRIPKKYALFFYYKDLPIKKSIMTFTTDISRGGVHFMASQPVQTGENLVFEISISYIAPEKFIREGVVVESKEIGPRQEYDVRAKFNLMDEQTNRVFDLMEK